MGVPFRGLVRFDEVSNVVVGFIVKFARRHVAPAFKALEVPAHMEWFMFLLDANGKEEGGKLPFLAAVKEEICGHFHWLRRCGIIRDDHQMNDGLRTWWNLAVRIFCSYMERSISLIMKG